MYRALVRDELIEPRSRRRRREDFRRWQRERPMQLWQLDVTSGVALADGSYAKLVTGIDDHSRFCVIDTVVAQATAKPVCGAFAAALRRYGVPDEVLTEYVPGHIFGLLFPRGLCAEGQWGVVESGRVAGEFRDGAHNAELGARVTSSVHVS